MENGIRLKKSLSFLGFLLGNFAALWGFVLAPIYVVAYGLLVSNAHASGGAMAVTQLPVQGPVMGLLLAVAGLALSQVGGSRDGRTASLIGLTLNGLAVTVAAGLLL
jgi:hypothetical protein